MDLKIFVLVKGLCLPLSSGSLRVREDWLRCCVLCMSEARNGRMVESSIIVFKSLSHDGTLLIGVPLQPFHQELIIHHQVACVGVNLVIRIRWSFFASKSCDVLDSKASRTRRSGLASCSFRRSSLLSVLKAPCMHSRQGVIKTFMIRAFAQSLFSSNSCCNRPTTWPESSKLLSFWFEIQRMGLD